VCFALKAGNWVVLEGTTDNLADKRRVEAVNQFLFYGLVVVAVLSAVQLLLDVRRLVRRRRDSALPRTAL